jgi:hypothetical protein
MQTKSEVTGLLETKLLNITKKEEEENKVLTVHAT